MIFKKKKGENDIFLKDYIASLILLAYNFELFFHKRKKNYEDDLKKRKENLEKKNDNLLGVKTKFITTKMP